LVVVPDINPSDFFHSFNAIASIMCGITAAIALDRLSDRQIRTPAYQKATLGQLWRSLATIRHRGPDSSGTWFSPDNRVGTSKAVQSAPPITCIFADIIRPPALAHTRLAIKDLSPTGAQPLHDATSSIHAIVNGELYDYASLKQELTEWGYTFQGDSDSELLLALYARDGLRCFESLRGEFAFVLYDSARQLVIAARDRYGVKPLFWTISEGRLLFASEAKALRPLGWKAQWDVRSITEDGWLHDERTLFKGVQKILPGHYMICHSFDFINSRRYWEVSFPDKHLRQERSEQDMIDELEERLVDAVTARMQGDVPMGVYLSGGLDSAAVAGIAVDVLKKKLIVRAKGQPLNDRSKAIEQLICFNVGFDSSTEYDETRESRPEALVLARGTDLSSLQPLHNGPQTSSAFHSCPLDWTRLPLQRISRRLSFTANITTRISTPWPSSYFPVWRVTTALRSSSQVSLNSLAKLCQDYADCLVQAKALTSTLEVTNCSSQTFFASRTLRLATAQ
jgi:asparagine synthase (glutamine-hydrolysing)